MFWGNLGIFHPTRLKALPTRWICLIGSSFRTAGQTGPTTAQWIAPLERRYQPTASSLNTSCIAYSIFLLLGILLEEEVALFKWWTGHGIDNISCFLFKASTLPPLKHPKLSQSLNIPVFFLARALGIVLHLLSSNHTSSSIVLFFHRFCVLFWRHVIRSHYITADRLLVELRLASWLSCAAGPLAPLSFLVSSSLWGA